MSTFYQWRTQTTEAQKTSLISRLNLKLKTNRSWILFGIGIFGFLALYNIFIQKAQIEDWWALLLLFCLYITANYFYRQYKNVKSLMLNFIFPLALAVLVLILGTIGFSLNSPKVLLANHFFSAANLITLNSSEFKDLCTTPNVFMRVSRLLGGFLAGYAFILAFSLAVGKENLSRLFFWIFRSWNSPKKIFQNRPVHLPFGYKKFHVVVGDGTKALDLAHDLMSHKTFFVFLDTSGEDYIHKVLHDASCWYFKGKAYSRKDLESTYFWKAEKVFILNESDENNFRAIQEIDEILDENSNNLLQLNVHFEGQKLRESVHTLLERRSPQLNAFSIAENTATRLLNEYPIDRFSETIKVAQIVIIGFNKQAQEIILACTRLGHYLGQNSLEIQVFLPELEKKSKKAFLNKYPMLNKEKYAENYKKPEALAIFEYTFQDINLTFSDLPESESLLRNPDFELNNLLQPTKASTLYVCLDEGMLNAQFLDSILPRLGYLKSQMQRDIQVFSYYNYPDRDEQEYIETKLNSLSNHILVLCFGNMLDECSMLKIENEENLDLSKRIAFIYHCLYHKSQLMASDSEAFAQFNDLQDELYSIPTTPLIDYETKKKVLLEQFFKLFYEQNNYEYYAEKHWKALRQIDRESNMQAANHVSVKLRQIQIGREQNSPKELSQEELNQLSEVEHRRWNAEKLLLGWLPHLNDTEWKTFKAELRKQKFHNYLVTFEQLPEYEKSKDWVQVMGVV